MQMWHLAFQPSLPGACGFFLECVLILSGEGRAACVGNGHSQGESAAVRRPHPAQAPSWETWGDAGFVWADVISPKGLLAQGWAMGSTKFHDLVAVPRNICPEKVHFKQESKYMTLFTIVSGDQWMQPSSPLV